MILYIFLIRTRAIMAMASAYESLFGEQYVMPLVHSKYLEECKFAWDHVQTSHWDDPRWDHNDGWNLPSSLSEYTRKFYPPRHVHEYDNPMSKLTMLLFPMNKVRIIEFHEVQNSFEKLHATAEGKGFIEIFIKYARRFAPKPVTIAKELKPKGKPKKASIPAAVKKIVWNTHVGEAIGKAKCCCCKVTDMTQMSFHCGHVVSEFNGGKVEIPNLRPICQNCNSSMGKMNMDEFMEKYKF